MNYRRKIRVETICKDPYVYAIYNRWSGKKLAGGSEKGKDDYIKEAVEILKEQERVEKRAAGY